MTDGRCATCKFWGALEPYEGMEVGEHGFPEGYGICELATSSDVVPRGAPYPGELLSVALVDPYNWAAPTDAELVTRHDFGCVQHDHKDGTA